MDKSFETTVEQFELFEKTTQRWIKEFGLVDAEVDIFHGSRIDDGFASVVGDSENRIFSIGFEKRGFDCGEGNNLSDKDIMTYAAHEVLEVLLMPMRSKAIDAGVNPDVVDEDIHRVIRVFENVFIIPIIEKEMLQDLADENCKDCECDCNPDCDNCDVHLDDRCVGCGCLDCDEDCFEGCIECDLEDEGEAANVDPCETCVHEDVCGSDEPCVYCSEESQWLPKEDEVEKYCENCLHEEVDFSDEPCNDCEKQDEWFPKEDEVEKLCDNCLFQDEEFLDTHCRQGCEGQSKWFHMDECSIGSIGALFTVLMFQLKDMEG